MPRDLVNSIDIVPAFAPTAAVTAAASGISINRTGYESVVFAHLIEVPGDTLSGSIYFEFDLQDSPDGSTWTAVADSLVQYAIGTANGAANTGAYALVKVNPAAAAVYQVGYLGIQPYVRISIAKTGSMSTGTVMSAVAILGNARHNPAGATQLP